MSEAKRHRMLQDPEGLHLTDALLTHAFTFFVDTLRDWAFLLQISTQFQRCARRPQMFTHLKVFLPDVQWLKSLGPASKGVRFLKVGRATDDTLQQVNSLTALRVLDLGDCQAITSTGLNRLASLRLTTLNVNECHRLTDLRALASCPELRHLSLDGCKLVDVADLAALTQTDAQLETLSARSVKLSRDGAKVLLRFKKLSSLDLSDCQLDDKSIASLSTLDQLRVLKLRSCDLHARGMQALSQLRNLTHLDVSFTPIQGLEQLTLLTALTDLNLCGCDELTDVGVQALAGFTALEHLNLYFCNRLTTAGLRCISGLPKLHTLDLYACHNLTDESLQALLPLGALKGLCLDHCIQVTDVGMGLVSRLPSLRTLSVCACNAITNVGLSSLSGLGLQSLDLSRTGITGQGLLAVPPSLQVLKVSGRKILDPDLQSLSALPLHTLELCNCQFITDAGIALVAPCAGLTNLRLNFTATTVEGLRALVHLPLQNLDLGSCQGITDDALEVLGSVTTLQTLVLRRCFSITDKGLRAISTLSRMNSLALPDCARVTDQGLQSLAELTNLKVLDLSGCHLLTDLGVQALSPLVKLRTLCLFNIPDITRHAANASCPNATVFVSDR